jgi:hypothetical protein
LKSATIEYIKLAFLLRRAAVQRVTFLTVAVMLALPAYADDASVISKSAPVYSGMATSSRILTTLKADDKVDLEFSIQSSGTEWCIIRKPVSGYMNCADLKRRIAPPARRVTEPESPAPATAQAPKPGVRLLPDPYNIAATQRRLLFTPEQNERTKELAETTGWSRCRNQATSWLAQHGLFTLMDWVYAGTELSVLAYAEIERCRPSFQAFLDEFPKIMTPEQREKWTLSVKGKHANPPMDIMTNLYSKPGSNK